MLPRSKATVIAAIKHAEAERLAEQGPYRKIIKAAITTPATEKHEQLLEALNEGSIEKLMEGECYPPTGEDWKLIKGYNWDQVPRRRQLEQIEDEDISFWLYMLGEVTEHTKRLSATAKYFGYFGCVNQKVYDEFEYWIIISKLKLITSEID